MTDKKKDKELSEMQQAKMNGMRFWLPGLLSTVFPEKKWDRQNPFPSNGIPSRFNAPKIAYHGRPLSFYGEIWIDDPQVARQLMFREKGRLLFDPQEAVDKLGISVEEMAENGYDYIEEPKSPVKKAPPPEKPKEPLPDFNRMTQEELIAWAMDHGIQVDRRWKLERLIDHLKIEGKKL